MPRAISEEKWEEFLERYAELGSIKAAATMVGIHRNSVTNKKRNDEDFCRRLDEAHSSFIDDFTHSWTIWYREELRKGERFPIEVAKLIYEHQARIGGVPPSRKPERLTE